MPGGSKLTRTVILLRLYISARDPDRCFIGPVIERLGQVQEGST